MTTHQTPSYRALAVVLVMVIILITPITACSQFSPGQAIEISPVRTEAPITEIYIGGTVSNPGFYPLEAGDTIENLVQAAGGITIGNQYQLALHIRSTGVVEEAQQVNINRAESWLLQALPGIGETIARNIIAYRQQNGPFRNINELTKVENIGLATYEGIKDLVTVAD
ncbi:MAG: helix-hairpin-helix domain-containing protein [Dehalococcoidales bacterium]|nr:helix-hairpin-helix domain-containing protein [Dehalococcoidales bacterium]